MAAENVDDKIAAVNGKKAVNVVYLHLKEEDDNDKTDYEKLKRICLEISLAEWADIAPGVDGLKW